MRSIGATLLALVVAAACCAAPPTLSAPETVYGAAGDWVFVQVTTDGKWVRFVPLDPGLTVFPAGKLKDPNETAFRAARPGTYKVLVYTGNAEGPADKTISLVVGVPPPTPTPGPDPSNPPGPQPPAPDPKSDAALVTSLKTALALDTAAKGALQKDYCQKLGEVYLEGARLLRADATNALTVAKFYEMTFNVSVAAGVPRRDQALTEVRKVIDGLGKFDTTTLLVGAEKDKYAALWDKIGASLREAAK